MQKGLRLIIMRHGQAEQPSHEKSDHERDLTTQGMTQVAKIGDSLHLMGWLPTNVILSDALRCRRTWETLSSKFKQEPQAHLAPSFYLAGLTDIQAVILALATDPSSILCIGHNPGWSLAVTELSRVDTALQEADAALLTHPRRSWQEAIFDTGGWKLEQLLTQS